MRSRLLYIISNMVVSIFYQVITFFHFHFYCLVEYLFTSNFIFMNSSDFVIRLVTCSHFEVIYKETSFIQLLGLFIYI